MMGRGLLNTLTLRRYVRCILIGCMAMTLWAGLDPCGVLASPALQNELLTQAISQETQETQAVADDDARLPTVASAERGITGTYTFTHADQTLRVRVQRDVDAPLVVRLRQVDRAGGYELRFIGKVEGRFDLRETLEDGWGQTVDSLPPMFVSIVSTLPDDQRSDLFEAANFQPKISGGYRVTLLLATVGWLLVPVIVYAIKAMRRPAVLQVAPTPPPPTFAEQLEPLVTAAANRSLSTREKGRLELLLLHYWRERVVLTELNMAAAIQQLRVHPEAGPLLNAVERWLHRDRDPVSTTGGDEDRSPEEILRLLLPYRSAMAFEPEQLQASGGSR